MYASAKGNCSVGFHIPRDINTASGCTANNSAEIIPTRLSKNLFPIAYIMDVANI